MKKFKKIPNSKNAMDANLEGSDMHKSYIQIAVMLTGPLALSGCLVAGETVSEALPTASKELPATNTGAVTETGINGYLKPGTGTWRVNLDGQVQSKSGGSVSLANAIVYDSDLNEWTVNFDGTNFVLAALTDGYASESCPFPTCAGFAAYDDPAFADQYGTFAFLGYFKGTKKVAVAVHYGLKTSVMPVDVTGTYTGIFEGAVYSKADNVGDVLTGTVTIDADFSSTGASLIFGSSGAGKVAGSTYTLTGGADFSGNTYLGTLTESSYTLGATTTVIDTTGSILSGAFYGPAAVETAGVVYSGGANAEMSGGFWATQ